MEWTCGPSEETLLHVTVRERKWQAAHFLIDSGASPNVKTSETIDTVDGTTPLHSAYANKDIEMIALLRQFGANPEIEDSLGRKAPFSIAGKDMKAFEHAVRRIFDRPGR